MILLLGPSHDIQWKDFRENANRDAWNEFKWNEDRNKTGCGTHLFRATQNLRVRCLPWTARVKRNPVRKPTGRTMRSLLAWRPTISIRKHLLLSHLPFCSLSLRQAAAVHERSVRPRLELPEEDELFVSSQVQSFREHVQEHVNDHRVEVIGAYTVLCQCCM